MALQPATAAGTVTVSVQGIGVVTGDGVNCTQSGGPDCSEFYGNVEECTETIPGKPPICTMVPPTVTFSAGPDSNGYIFDTWIGCDSAEGRECTVVVADNVNPIARFRDAQSPSVSSVSPSGGVRSGTITLSATASDNAGVTKVEFYNGASKLGEDSSAPYQLTWNSTTVADGAKSLTAKAYDAAGHVTTSSVSQFTVDNTLPTVSVTSGPDSQTFGPGSTQSWTFTVGDATSAVAATCSVVPEGGEASYGPCSGGATSHTVANQPEGAYEFRVRARDAAGNDRHSPGHVFVIDATAPETSIVGGPPDGSSTRGDVIFSLASTEAGATFKCRVWPAGLTPPPFEPCDGGTTHSAPGLADGRYEFEAVATDTVGNLDQSPVRRVFTVDTVAPQTTLTRVPRDRVYTTTRTTRVTFGFSTTESGSRFQCRMDGNAWASCTSPKTYRISKGSHTFKVRAIDAAGNRDATPASNTFRVIRC